VLKVVDDKKGLESVGLQYLDAIINDGETIATNVWTLLDEDFKKDIELGTVEHIWVECYINHSGEIAFCQFPECRSEGALIKLVYDLTKNGLAVWEDD